MEDYGARIAEFGHELDKATPDPIDFLTAMLPFRRCLARNLSSDSRPTSSNTPVSPVSQAVSQISGGTSNVPAFSDNTSATPAATTTTTQTSSSPENTAGSTSRWYKPRSWKMFEKKSLTPEQQAKRKKRDDLLSLTHFTDSQGNKKGILQSIGSGLGKAGSRIRKQAKNAGSTIGGWFKKGPSTPSTAPVTIT